MLKNQRHELFAQGIAAGKTAADAYVDAGYRPSRSAASRLCADVNIQARVAEIINRAAQRVELDRAWVLDGLKRNFERAMTEVPVTDRDGNPTGEFQYEGSVANRALELIGKEIGMFVERRISVNKNAANDATDEELLAIARAGGDGAAQPEASAPKPGSVH